MPFILFVVRRALAVAPLVVSVLALVIASMAVYEARKAPATPSLVEVQAEGVERFMAAGNKMTPPQVRELLGEPTEVFRNNPRALCWRYDTGSGETRMCWGPKRKQAWISTTIPLSRA